MTNIANIKNKFVRRKLRYILKILYPEYNYIRITSSGSVILTNSILNYTFGFETLCLLDVLVHLPARLEKYVSSINGVNERYYLKLLKSKLNEDSGSIDYVFNIIAHFHITKTFYSDTDTLRLIQNSEYIYSLAKSDYSITLENKYKRNNDRLIKTFIHTKKHFYLPK